MTRESRYFHLSPDDKFFDYVIENCEKVAPSESVYVVRTNSRKLQYVQNQNVVVAANLSELLKIYGNCSGVKYVYIHYLKGLALDFVLELPEEIVIIWIFWGSDGYALPSLKKNLLSRETKKLWHSRLPISVRFKDYLKSFLSKYYTGKLERCLKKISYCATWVRMDYEMVKPYHPEMEYIFFSNNSVEQLIGHGIPSKPSTGAPYIYIGNSGDPTNNHIDVLKLVRWETAYDVVVPLSYGENDYIKLIYEKGKQLLKDRFKPVMDFLPKEEYHSLLLQSSCVIMNHVRQQAANNIIVALYHGVPVFMNPNSPLFKTFKSWDIIIYSIEELKDFFKSPDKYLVDSQVNQQALKKWLGNSALERQYKDLLFIQ